MTKKVVQFPNLKKRLLERGYEALHKKDFEVAYQCFNQMHQQGIHSNESELAVVICLVELNEGLQAKERCEPLIFEVKPPVMDAVEIYLTILVNLQDYEQITITLEWLEKQVGVDVEHLERLKGLMDFAHNQQKYQEDRKEESTLVDTLTRVLLHTTNVGHQLSVVNGLKESNIRMYLSVLKEYLVKEDAHPIVQSTILLLLMEQGVNEEIELLKLGEKQVVTPVELKPSTEEPRVWEILSVLEREIENENPTMYGLLKQYFIQYLYTTFPLVYPYTKEEYAAALYYFGCQLQGIEVSEETILQQFGINHKEILIKLYNHFLDLEKYSQFDV